MKENINKNEENIIFFDFVVFMICLIAFMGFIVYFGFKFHHNFKISQEIIKQSEEYTVYNKCKEIQGKYYCK